MTEIPVQHGPADAASSQPASSGAAEVEREVTKRRLIESVTTVVLVVLYMMFSWARDRDPGVISLDGDTKNDWTA